MIKESVFHFRKEKVCSTKVGNCFSGRVVSTRIHLYKTRTYVHGTEDEDADEEPVAQLEQAVPAAAYVVDRGDPHGQCAQGGHPPHRDVDASVARLHVDRLPHGVAPPVDPDPVDYEKEAVDEHRGESEVARDGVVEHGALEGHPDGGPYLAVAGDRDENDGEVGGAHESHVDGDRP